MRSVTGSFAVLVALGLSGCGNGDAALPAIVSDSAGVTIIQNSAAAQEVLPQWRLAQRPDLRIGVQAGPEEYQFHIVRGAVQLDRRVAVLNTGTREVRFYDTDGRYLGRAGGQGSGPGEFEVPSTLHRLPGDSLVVFDDALQRFSVLSPEGEYARSVTPPRPTGPPWGFVNGSTMVSFGFVGGPPPFNPDSEEGVHEGRYLARLVDIESGVVDTLGVVGRREVFLWAIPGRGAGLTDHPFNVWPSLSTWNGEIFLTDGLTPEVRVYDSHGSLSRIVRIDREVGPVTAQEFNQVVEARVAEASDPREARRRYGQLSPPNVRPVYDELLVSRDGGVWIRHAEFREPVEFSWTIIDPDGHVAGTIRLPATLRPTDITPDFVLGVLEDDLGVERVVRFAVERTELE